MNELSLAVVGLDFPNADRSNRRFEMALCVPGEPVHLVREPRNKADPRAVAVVSCRAIQLGYLTAERCGWIGARIGSGEAFEALFQDHGRHAAVIRVRFGGGTVTLPAPRPTVEDEPFDWGA
ncbi:HIRAN domain-containing protein [Sphingomonas oligophenolica]|uniref:HIRAN domain-containing protein n=1 Tax=Sphingomonas oligophenolica TaxID=301154 RepID=A0A502CS20_9SPHN|nr:HIRAN domain-containing protein [Sphingomonas oligophenolica]TPG14596.1 hypothetical protein EAH84_03285 [Sphingomonas oligophenolica]